MRRLTVTAESWPIAGTFTISRGSKTAADVVLVEIAEGDHRGRGECMPYDRYGESVAKSITAIEIAARAAGGGPRPQGIASEDESMRGAQCVGLRALGPGGEAERPQCCGSGRLAGAEAGDHGLYAEPGQRGEHGSGGEGQRPPAAVEAQARRAGRFGPRGRRACQRAELAADRRCQ